MKFLHIYLLFSQKLLAVLKAHPVHWLFTFWLLRNIQQVSWPGYIHCPWGWAKNNPFVYQLSYSTQHDYIILRSCKWSCSCKCQDIYGNSLLKWNKILSFFIQLSTSAVDFSDATVTVLSPKILERKCNYTTNMQYYYFLHETQLYQVCILTLVTSSCCVRTQYEIFRAVALNYVRQADMNTQTQRRWAGQSPDRSQTSLMETIKLLYWDRYMYCMCVHMQMCVNVDDSF